MVDINLAKGGADPGTPDFEDSERFQWGTVLLPLVIVLGVSYGLDFYQSTLNDKLIGRIQTGIKKRDRLKAELDTLQAEGLPRDKLDAREAQLRKQIAAIENLTVGRNVQFQILYYLSDAIPSLVWLDRFRVTGRNISLSGQSMEFNQVSDFLSNLRESPFFEELGLRSSEQRSTKKGQELTRFELGGKWGALE